MIFIVLIALVFALALFPTFHCAVFHPVALIYNGAKDLYFYIRRKEYNLCGTGELVAYTGLFGKGKTLSAVHRVVSAYRQYEGKQVWCPRRREFVAQRFGHVDALLRQVTSYVIDCDKLWRFQRLNFYDAWDLENATNTQLVTPFSRRCWFVMDRDYNAYNTLACVGNLKKAMKEGDMMSEEEILKLQQNTEAVNMEGVSRPSRRWLRNKRRQMKK